MSSIESLIITYFLTGLAVGFGHCIGMCGPLVISFTLNRRKHSFYLSQLLYHCGRTATYALLGAAIGITGSFTMVAASIAAVQKGVMFFCGALIVAMGFAMGGWLPKFPFFGPDQAAAGLFAGWFKRLSHGRSVLAYVPLGMLLGLLPCGPVYTALLGAARAGMEAQTPYQGAIIGFLIMAAFGAGNIPALFSVAKLADLGWLKFRDTIYKAGAVMMIGVGIYFLFTAFLY